MQAKLVYDLKEAWTTVTKNTFSNPLYKSTFKIPKHFIGEHLNVSEKV